jgi:hypothetical protein
MKLTREHFNVSRHVKPTLLQRWAKKIRSWRIVRELELSRRDSYARGR